jgi:hypothetical protein
MPTGTVATFGVPHGGGMLPPAVLQALSASAGSLYVKVLLVLGLIDYASRIARKWVDWWQTRRRRWDAPRT